MGKDSIQGLSADGRYAFFVAQARLTAEASPALDSGGTPVGQVYVHDSASGTLQVASVRPDGVADPGGSNNHGAEVGGGVVATVGGHLAGAVSSDGGRVYWSAAAENGHGGLYLRENPTAAESPREGGVAIGSGDLSNGSAEVTNVSAASGAFAVGQRIAGSGFAGSGIPFGTTITAVGRHDADALRSGGRKRNGRGA